MSKISLTPDASGTGTFTLASPNSNTNRTLTLPDAAGELLTTTGDGSGLTSLTSANLTGALPAIDGSGLTSLTAANLTGALPAIDGSALTGISTTPTTAQVLTATAGSATGAVGTYAWLIYSTANSSWADGATFAGSGFNKTTISRNGNSVSSSYLAGSSGGVPSGTWRALSAQYARSNFYPAGLFLRIS